MRCSRATPLLDKEFPPWSDELYLDFSKTGRRPPAEAMIRAREVWLEPLVTAECVENQGRFLPAIHRTLEAYLAQPTWTLPAHDHSLDNFHRRKYTVDLRAAETSADLAQALWLLGDRIDPGPARPDAGSSGTTHLLADPGQPENPQGPLVAR